MSEDSKEFELVVFNLITRNIYVCDELGMEHDFDESEDRGDNVWRVKCKSCGYEEEEYLFVEYWADKTITVAGKTYSALKAWGNISLCSECGKPIFNVPLILWDSEDPTKALTFHFKCAERVGIGFLEPTTHIWNYVK